MSRRIFLGTPPRNGACSRLLLRASSSLRALYAALAGPPWSPDASAAPTTGGATSSVNMTQPIKTLSDPEWNHISTGRYRPVCGRYRPGATSIAYQALGTCIKHVSSIDPGERRRQL